jgi:hypothetical protein
MLDEQGYLQVNIPKQQRIEDGHQERAQSTSMDGWTIIKRMFGKKVYREKTRSSITKLKRSCF